MASSNIRKATCLCGAVEITAALKSQIGACHCAMCRKWGGGPLFAVHCDDNVKISGADNISRYDSSAWAERGFCRTCGTHLFYRLKKSGQYSLPAGLLDDQADLNFDQQIFIDKKPGYYDFANATENLTEAQVLELFSDNV